MSELQPRRFAPGEKADWLADKIVSGNAYCKEAAMLLRFYAERERKEHLVNPVMRVRFNDSPRRP